MRLLTQDRALYSMSQIITTYRSMSRICCHGLKQWANFNFIFSFNRNKKRYKFAHRNISAWEAWGDGHWIIKYMSYRYRQLMKTMWHSASTIRNRTPDTMVSYGSRIEKKSHFQSIDFDIFLPLQYHVNVPI